MNLAAPTARQRAAGIAIVAVVVLVQVLSQFVANRDIGRTASVIAFLAVEMPPLMFALSGLFAFARRKELGLGVTVLAGIGVSGAIGLLFGLAFWEVADAFPAIGLRLSTVNPLSPLRAAIFGFTNGLGHFGLWTLAFALPSALQADKLRLEAERLKVAAELARLRSHLEPHFLLNTLNAIAGLVTEDAKEARKLLSCLGDLLREALHEGDELQTIDQQVAWLKRYAEILQSRHRGALTFKWELDPKVAQVLVPRLLLQPLVENAVQHGALRRPDGGEVVVRTAADGNGARVVCTIEDNGPGMPAEVRSGAFGIQSVRRRLELRYPARSKFSIESSATGTRSIVELPAS